MTADSVQQPMRLSVIVIAYNMAREIPRTLASLSRPYQDEAENLDYEVILVDNGSTEPLDPATWSHIDIPLRQMRFDSAHPSPAQAINHAVNDAQGDYVCLMIDGAHVVTPGVFRLALAATQAFADAAVAVRYFFLGPDEQNKSIEEGYCKTIEDALFESINWPENGYQLFEIGTPFRAGAGSANWLHKMFESNCLFIRRSTFFAIGGADEALIAALRTYARGIGLAFQIIDDILDITASSEVLGKTAGKDLIADKTTYPKLLGLDESRRRADALVSEAKQALEPWADQAMPLLALADFITSRDR